MSSLLLFLVDRGRLGAYAKRLDIFESALETGLGANGSGVGGACVAKDESGVTGSA